ncbi:MAG: sporulation protein YqfD, partial [Halanaerobiales bacterium]
FLRYKIRQRYFLILGFILFIIIIYCASSFLWFININGLDKIKEDRIYNILYKYDIKPGTPKRELDLDEIEKILLQEESNISWVDLDWQGTRLNIEIVEKKLIEEQKTDKIVAARNGIINELIVLRGRSIVEEGETVTENQVLILPGKSSDDLRMEAIVKAEVWYETFGEAQFEEKEPVYTGDTITKWKINLGSYTFEIPYKDIRFDEYVIQKRKKNLPKWRNISIPIELNKEKYNEVEYLIEERNYDETLYHAKNQALKKMLKKLSSSTVILESKFEIVDIDEEDKILVRMLLKSEENIAKKVSNSN